MAKIVEIQEVSLKKIKPYEKNAKIHGKEQVKKIAESIQAFGFLSPCLIDKDMNLIAGHGRVMAAKELGMESVPCLFIEGLSEEQRRAYILADNRLTEMGEWDEYILQSELEALMSEGFDIELTGFEIDLEDEKEIEEVEADLNPIDMLPESKIYVLAVSAFGTDSEKIVMKKLPQTTADNLLKAIDERPADEIVSKLMEGLNDL